jgi:hypothetical protein
MGVMNCSRRECSSIMCDTYIESIGYVCYECQAEFKEYLQKNGLNPTTESQIKEELEKFMITPKGSHKEGKDISVDDFFNERTR